MNRAAEVSQGFFLAQRLADGTPGRPIGNEDGAVMMFEELEVAREVIAKLSEEDCPLAIFKVNLVYVGEVIC